MSTRCPHCFALLPADRFAFVCTATCPETQDPRYSRAHGAPRMSKTITDAGPVPQGRGYVPPTNVRCRRCSGNTRECCPLCHFPLPEDWRSFGTTCIALAGSRSSGKSVYIGVLLQFLAVYLNAQPNSSLTFEGDSEKRFQATYKQALDDARRLQGTARAAQADAPQRIPLIMRGQIDGYPHALVFRDVAGEDLEQGDAPDGALDFYRNASAVFFLYDPTALQSIRAQLGLRLALSQPGGPPGPVLEYVSQLMGRQGNMAIIMSKFDVLHELVNMPDSPLHNALVNPGAAMRRDPGPKATFDAADATLLGFEVRSLLLRMDPSNVITTFERDPRNHAIRPAYFAVSALGAQPDGDHLNPAGIAPYRILDPLRWAFYLSLGGQWPLA